MNPFHSTPEATAFWQAQREACEAAGNTLVKHPSIAAFLRAGGRIEVAPTHIPARDAFCILCKDGDSILCAIPAYLPEDMPTFHRDTVDQLTAWLRDLVGLPESLPYLPPLCMEDAEVFPPVPVGAEMEAHDIAPVRKCDSCVFCKTYRTGMDEYPLCTTIEYCAKNHWEDGPPIEDGEPDPWKDCLDYKPAPAEAEREEAWK